MKVPPQVHKKGDQEQKKNTYDRSGDETPDDDLHADIIFHRLNKLYLIGSPEMITMKHGEKFLRNRRIPDRYVRWCERVDSDVNRYLTYSILIAVPIQG